MSSFKEYFKSPFEVRQDTRDKILVVDDDHETRAIIAEVLEFEKFSVVQAENGNKAKQELNSVPPPSMMLLDIKMPGQSGLEILKESLDQKPDLKVVMISGFDESSIVAQCMAGGAMNFLYKPFDIDYLVSLVNETLTNPPPSKKILDFQHSLRDETDALRSIRRSQHPQTHMVGKSSAIRTVVEQIGFAAKTSSLPVLITGETGTGKEVVAELLHQQSSRATEPLVKVNISSLQPNLIASELFGHVKGAFTDANRAHNGVFYRADEGTLFLDEIGDLTPDAQVLLLRALREKTIIPVGGEDEIKLDVWVIAATNKNIPQEIREGNFREDLYQRLKTIPIHLPPLRERQEDIPRLIAHFLSQDYPQTQISEDAVEELCKRVWLGNVAELKQVIDRAATYSQGKIITLKHLNEAPQDFDRPATLQVQKVRAIDRKLFFKGRNILRFLRGTEKNNSTEEPPVER